MAFCCGTRTLIALLLSTAVAGITLEVSPGVSECFYRKIRAQRHVRLGVFVLSGGGGLDIGFHVKTVKPDGKGTTVSHGTVVSSAASSAQDSEAGPESDGTSFYAEQNEIYEFCLHHTGKDGDLRVVKFDVMVQKYHHALQTLELTDAKSHVHDGKSFPVDRTLSVNRCPSFAIQGNLLNLLNH